MGKKYAILGNPVEHSLSPTIQNAAFAYYGLDYSYSKRLINSEEHLNSFLKDKNNDYSGFNVTLPYKNCVLKYIDSFSDGAGRANSVNLIKREENGLMQGFSTDGYGLEMALRRNFDSSPASDKYLFIGCGGAVAACVSHLLEVGARHIGIANRTISKASALVTRMKSFYPDANLFYIDSADDERLINLAEENYLFIQATSLGLSDKDVLPIKEELLFKDMRISDMIYTKTNLAEAAAQRGCGYISGVDMLLYQGAKSFEIWTELEAPVDVMRKAIYEAVRVQI